MKAEDVKALVAELVGTFWLVLGGCGAAVLASDFGLGGNGTSLGIGFLGVSLAFGLTVVTGAYALGHVSGGHFNPAITLGLVAGGRFAPAKAVGYVIAQVVGGIVAAAVLFGIASGQDGWEKGTFAANGYDEFSPGGYGLGAAFLAEVVLTAVFLVVIMGVTSKKAAPAMGGLAIGLTLTLIHLVSIPVTNTSVNPARSTSQAIFAGADQLAQLWLFWVAPILGGVLGALLHRYLIGDPEDLIDTVELAQGDETLR
ncbi:aquaporin Z [Ilumatobacter nonamiensis]|uniref:aquaporin Z n=1 Tax=Ilumatobacter nonamiensis TaxID=467093 RepID=UPI0003467FF9|nr:aquaporin Z [Ilumatobacter nonamiensis]